MSACPFHYVFSDMDGTLLGPDHQLSPLAKRTLRTLSVKRRVPIVLATGRIHYDVSRVADDLVKYIHGEDTTVPFPGAEIYLITSNGAVVHNALTGALLSERCMDAALVEEMYRFLPADATGVNTSVHQNDRWLCRLHWPEMEAQYIVSGMRCTVCPDPPPRRTFPADEVHHMTVADGCFDGVVNMCFDAMSLEHLQPSAKALLAHFADRSDAYAYTYSMSLCLDVMAPGVSKGVAVPTVLEQLCTSRGETLEQALAASVAFGDGLNDESMLEVVGRGFVMANANPDLLTACPDLEVIPSNAEDGVARTLRKVFQLADDE